MIPEGAEVFNSTSETLDTIGYSDYLHNNPRYRNLHDEVAAETDPVKLREKRRLATVSEYVIGSVQAISETGEIVVASGSGSQLGAFVFGAKYVILVAGTQKICPTLSDAIDRTRGYTLDRHDKWLQAQGRGARPVGKLAILENEVGEGRVRVILIKQNLGW
jgi:L-lactate utilization protein LutC